MWKVSTSRGCLAAVQQPLLQLAQPVRPLCPSALIAPSLTPAPAPRLLCPPLAVRLQAKQFVASRRDELLELQRSLLGFEEIAVREGLKPSEAEIEVRRTQS